MQRAALIITSGDADEYGRHRAQMPSDPSEQLLADLRIVLWNAENALPYLHEHREAVARVRALLPEEAHDGFTRAQADANARLVSAAPDLLDACEEVLEAESYGPAMSYPRIWKAWDAMRAAVKKARGERSPGGGRRRR